MNRSRQDESPEVSAIIDRWIALNDQGLQISVEELCKESPHLVEHVVRQIRALDQMDGLLNTHAGSTLNDADQAATVRRGARSGQASTTHSYQLQRLHASGGCSEVYVAVDTQLGREVAIKFLRPDFAEHADSHLRLQREASITSRLNHPGVVSIHSMGHDAAGQPFYTMRFVEGQSLKQAIERLYAVSQETESAEFNIRRRKLLNHFLDVCQTIAYAHEQAVIHRDLKPENIVIGSFGESYVIDWGLAKQLGDPAEPDHPSGPTANLQSDQLTRVGASVGTPAYMSPEQASGKEIGPPSDIFNLGATLYTILTGRPPYGGSHVLDVIKCAVQAEPPAPREIIRDIDASLQAICQKAMAAKAEDRYASATELANDLERYLADQPVGACPEPLREKVRRWVKRRRTVVSTAIASAIVAMVLLAIGMIVVLEKNRRLAASESQAVTLRNKTTDALNEATAHLYSHRIALAHSELLKNNVGRADEILLQCPAELRRWEWHHLRWLVDRHKPMQSFPSRGSMIRALAFSGDGSKFAYADLQGRISVFRVDGWRLENELDDGLEVWSMAFSPDARHLVAAGAEVEKNKRSGMLHLWDLENAKLVTKRAAHGRVATSVQYSIDGQRILSGGSRGDMRVRDATDLMPIHRITAHDEAVRDVAFLHSDGRELSVTASEDGGFRIWNPGEEDELLQAIRAHPGGVTAMDVHHDLLLATAGKDQLLRTWKIKSDEQLQGSQDGPVRRSAEILVGHRDQIETVAFSPDGKMIASGGMDRNVRLWDIETGQSLAVIRRHTSHVRSVLFDPKGRYLVTAGDDAVVHIWSVNDLVQQRPTGQLVSFSPHRDHVATATARSLVIWDVSANQLVAQAAEHPAIIHGINFSPDGEYVGVVYRDGSCALHDARDGSQIGHMQKNLSIAYSLEFSDEGDRFAVGHHDGTIEIWNTQTQELDLSLHGDNVAFRLAFTADSHQLIVGHTDGSIAVWNLVTNSVTRVIPAHSRMLLDLKIHPDGTQLATTASDGFVKIWDLQSGGLKHTMRVGASWVNCLQFSPAGDRLLSGSEHTVMFWDCNTGDEILSVSVDRCVHSMSFSGNGRYLAVAGEDPHIRLWQGLSNQKVP